MFTCMFQRTSARAVWVGARSDTASGDSIHWVFRAHAQYAHKRHPPCVATLALGHHATDSRIVRWSSEPLSRAVRTRKTSTGSAGVVEVTSIAPAVRSPRTEGYAGRWFGTDELGGLAFNVNRHVELESEVSRALAW